MKHHAVDPLHLNLLGKFKAFLSGTIFMFMSDEMLLVLQEWLQLMGFQLRLSREPGEDPTKSWIGPDCRRLMEDASKYLPHMLMLAHAPASAGPAAREALEVAKADRKEGPPAPTDADDEDDDGDYDEPPTAEEIAANEVESPVLMKCARAWDTFFVLADYESRLFIEDTDKYRAERMVAYFNAEVACKRVLIDLGVYDHSFNSHIGMCVVTRQIMEDGDPGKRGCNVNEAFGAKCKDVIHNLVCRRVQKTEKTMHKKQKADGTLQTWQQAFRVGRIAQTFRHMCIRKKMIDDPRYTHLRQRKDMAILHTGRANRKAAVKVKPDLDHLKKRVLDAVLTYSSS
jgi:hypothetical protein